MDLSGTVSKEYRLACGFDQVYSSAEIIRGIGGGLAPPTLAFLVLRMAWNTVGRGIPMFFAPYYSGGMEKELEKILESEKISRVWAYGVLGGQICRNISAKHKMLYMCDSNAYLYHNLLKVERNPAIWCMMKFDEAVSRRFELEIRKKYGLVAFINQNEGKWLGMRPDEYLVLPLIRESNARVGSAKEYDVVLAGRWDYLPNSDYLNYALDNIFPRLSMQCKIAVLGFKHGKEHLEKIGLLEKKAPNLKFTVISNAQDYFGVLESSRIFLLSIRVGAGTCNKVLDGLEAGMPLLVTPFLKMGSDPENECPGLVVCKDAADFAKRIGEILSDEGLAESLGIASRKYYLKKYSDAEKPYIDAIRRAEKDLAASQALEK